METNAPKRPTLADVAREAGVTHATVSNVISGRVHVAEATRTRVEAAIAALGYEPNLVARSLVSRRTMLLALIVPRITNPFYAEVALELEGRVAEHEYHLVICNTRNEPAEGRSQLQRLSRRWIDGAIVMPGGVDAADVDAVSRRGLVVVPCLWAEEARQPAMPGVDLDFAAGGALAATHLLGLGHRRLGMIVESRPDGCIAHVRRVDGFRAALAQSGVEIPPTREVTGDGTLDGGRAAAELLLRQPNRPTAIFATNDLMALGVIEAALDQGLPVPAALSVVGFDDIPLARHVRPRLTSVAMPRAELVTSILHLLLPTLGGQRLARERVLIPPSLVPRDSTARVKNGSHRKAVDMSG
jgi:DNA-binding LacI/PurR family transcriptional regulator